MMTAAELTQARADVLETLVSDVTIQRPSASINDSGYPTESWSTAGTVKGRIDNMSRGGGSNDVIAMQETGRAYYQLTVTYDADIIDGDRVQVGAADSYEARCRACYQRGMTEASGDPRARGAA